MASASQVSAYLFPCYGTSLAGFYGGTCLASAFSVRVSMLLVWRLYSPLIAIDLLEVQYIIQFLLIVCLHFAVSWLTWQGLTCKKKRGSILNN